MFKSCVHVNVTPDCHIPTDQSDLIPLAWPAQRFLLVLVVALDVCHLAEAAAQSSAEVRLSEASQSGLRWRLFFRLKLPVK